MEKHGSLNVLKRGTMLTKKDMASSSETLENRDNAIMIKN
jgi:hypothetical protein